MLTLSDICPCGRCDVLAYTLKHGLIWYFCGECRWWYIAND